MSQITLSTDQERAVESIMGWWNEAKEITYDLPEEECPYPVKQTFTLGGYAGTGKSTILAYIRKELGADIRVGFVSLTGKAVSVMWDKLSGDEILGRGDVVSTLHAYMYRPIINGYGQVVDWEWKEMGDKEEEAPPVDLFINDEASMTSEELYKDLKEYGKPILAVGDHGQLPPVNSTLNLMANPIIRLERIHRQAQDNPILRWATLAREGKRIPYEKLSDKVIKLTKAEALKNDFSNNIIENPSQDRVLIVPTNAMRVSLNKRIRKHLGFKQENEPEPEDRVICLRNNSSTGIYNGLLGTVSYVGVPFKHEDINYRMSIISDGDERKVFCDVTKHTFNNETGKDPAGFDWRNGGTRWDFGYALTCHKTQGSEWPQVLVWGEGWPAIRNRWLYTAITRAKDTLVLIN